MNSQKLNMIYLAHINGDHERIETRKVWLVSEIKWLIDSPPRRKEAFILRNLFIAIEADPDRLKLNAIASEMSEPPFGGSVPSL